MAPPPNTTPFEYRVSTHEFWEDTNIQLISPNIVTLGVRVSTYEFGGAMIQSIADIKALRVWNSILEALQII